MITKKRPSEKELAGKEPVNDATEDSVPGLGTPAEHTAKIMIVRLTGSAQIRPGIIGGTISMSGDEGFDIIPKVTRWLKDHHANIAAVSKTLLHLDVQGVDVHGAHYVFLAPEAEFRRIDAEISAKPIWQVRKPAPTPTERTRKAKVKIIVPNGEGIVWRISEAVEARGIFIRTMACNTFIPKDADGVPDCWRTADGGVGELGAVDMKIEMDAAAANEIESLADELWQIGEQRWDICIEETTPEIEERFYVERTPMADAADEAPGADSGTGKVAPSQQN